MSLSKGGDSFDWFFLAMANWQLGNKELARQWYDRAIQWMDKNQSQDAELRRFRAEAGKLLGLPEEEAFPRDKRAKKKSPPSPTCFIGRP